MARIWVINCSLYKSLEWEFLSVFHGYTPLWGDEGMSVELIHMYWDHVHGTKSTRRVLENEVGAKEVLHQVWFCSHTWQGTLLKVTHFYEVSCPTFAHSGDLERHPKLHVFGWTELFDFWRTQIRWVGYSWIMGSLGLNSKAHIALSKFKYSYNIELYCVWIEECPL